MTTPGTLCFNDGAGWTASWFEAVWCIGWPGDWSPMSRSAERLTRERGILVDGDPDASTYYDLSTAVNVALTLAADDLLAG